MKLKHFILIITIFYINQSEAIDFNNILFLYSETTPSNSYIEYVQEDFNERNPANIEDISSVYHSNIKFWFDVYSKYSSEKILIHSKLDLSKKFKILDLSKVYKNAKNSIVAEILKNRLVNHELNVIKTNLQTCYKKKSCNFDINYNYKLSDILESLRTQTGQLDILQRGIKRFKPYQTIIENIIQQTNTDPNWIAIPFLESSFNNHAVSKVGATGAWQIMKSVGRRLMPINNHVDTRKNPIIASYAGLKILRQSRIITKNDDITIISYNSGLKNFFKMKKILNKKNISTEEYLSKSTIKNKEFNFASENFLLEYYAMKAFLKENLIIKEIKSRNISSQETLPKIYISKCKSNPGKVLKILKKLDHNVNLYNNHFKKNALNKTLEHGQIYITTATLPSRYYKLIKPKNLDNMAPINWKADYNNCSII